jgi:hypothetical protein
MVSMAIVTSVMATIISLGDLGKGIGPWLFPEGGGIGFGTSDGRYAMVISNIHIVRTLGKSHIVKPCLLTLEVFKGLYTPRQKGITSHG